MFNETHIKFKRIHKKNIDLRPVTEHESTERSKFYFSPLIKSAQIFVAVNRWHKITPSF